jgi:hypothetical protein
MNETIQKNATFLFSPLPLVEEPKDKDKKPKATDLIEFILKQRAGSTASAPTFKLKVSRFWEGTVSEWISFRKAISELWKQNSLTNAQDKIANICTILCGDSLTGFEERIQELTTSVDDTGETVTMEIANETVEDGLNAVAHMVFPFRALENQNSGCDVACESPRSFQFENTWLLSEDLTTVYQSFLTVRNGTKSLPKKSSRYWNGPFPKVGEPNST